MKKKKKKKEKRKEKEEREKYNLTRTCETKNRDMAEDWGDFPRFQLKTTYVVKSARQLQRKKAPVLQSPLQRGYWSTEKLDNRLDTQRAQNPCKSSFIFINSCVYIYEDIFSFLFFSFNILRCSRLL